jgi:membrane-associated phospholipid phosphatase
MGYGVAAGVGVSRVAAGRHFPSDVLAGAALGTVSGVVAYKVRF